MASFSRSALSSCFCRLRSWCALLVSLVPSQEAVERLTSRLGLKYVEGWSSLATVLCCFVDNISECRIIVVVVVVVYDPKIWMASLGIKTQLARRVNPSRVQTLSPPQSARRPTNFTPPITMINITSDAIPWLTKGTPGYSLFADPPKQPLVPKYILAATETEEATPQRRIASRGTEVFVAAGCEIRCVDLRVLKAQYEEEREGTGKATQISPKTGRGYQVSGSGEILE